MKSIKHTANLTAAKLSAMIFTIELGKKLQESKGAQLRYMREVKHQSMNKIAENLNLQRMFHISPSTARGVVQRAIKGYKGDSKISNTEPYEGIVSLEINNFVKKKLQIKSFKLAKKQAIDYKKSGFFTMSRHVRIENGKKSVSEAYPDRKPYSEIEEKIILKCLRNPQKYSVKSGGNKGKIDASRISQILHRLGYKRESQHITKAIPRIARRYKN